MSIEGNIFEVREALRGKPELASFEKLELIIPGSSLLEPIAEELRQIAADHKQNCAYVKNRELMWGKESELYYYKRLIAWADELQGFKR